MSIIDFICGFWLYFKLTGVFCIFMQYHLSFYFFLFAESHIQKICTYILNASSILTKV